MAKAAEKIINDPEIGPVTLRRSVSSRSLSIRVHPVKGVSVSVPYIVPYAAAKLFFQARRGWILETMERQRQKYKDVKVASPSEIEALRRQAKALYLEAFPKEERLPWWLLRLLAAGKRSDLTAFYDGETFCGLAYTATAGDIFYVMFFAVAEDMMA